jgi:hypothetical protein
MNFILKFGKYKGENFSNTPKWYQDWLLKQDWFKVPAPAEPKYKLVRKFVAEYRLGMGRAKEIIFEGLSWQQANEYKDTYNIYQIDDLTEYFYIE